MDDTQRDELLISMRGDVSRVVKLLDGNGRRGLVEEVAILKDDMRRRESEADELRAGVPSKRDKALVSSGVLTALIIAVLTAVKTVFFT